jgi:hypothetical protein
MRRHVVPVLIAIASIVAVVVGWRIYAADEAARYVAMQRVLHAPSIIKLRYRVAYQRGEVAFEEYDIRNIDGKAHVDYSAQNRRGDKASFSQDVPGFDVSVLFESLVRDGVWELPSVKPAGNTEIAYAVGVEQTTENASGKHAFTFTDPEYWKSRAGRLYHIDLAKSKVPSQDDLLKMQSTQIAQPGFAKVVTDFNAFAPPNLRKTIVAAKAKLRAS